MQKDVITLVTKHMDKNHAVELWSDDKQKVNRLEIIFNHIHFMKTNYLYNPETLFEKK
jgi:hypothetical protein